MSKEKNSHLLANLSFEDIMAEAEATTDDSERVRGSSKGDSVVHRSSSSCNSPIRFNIIKNYGKLLKKKNAATFALVDWNGYKRYDLRIWNEDYSIPYKGITFSEAEIPLLITTLSGYTHQFYAEPQHIYISGKANAKIFDTLCTLSSSIKNGEIWNKQINIIDWGFGAKIDFRKWTETYDKCSKGICLNEDEIYVLLSILEIL